MASSTSMAIDPEHQSDDESVASSCGFETAYLPSDGEEDDGPQEESSPADIDRSGLSNNSGSPDELRLDWEASQASTPPTSQLDEPVRLDWQTSQASAPPASQLDEPVRLDWQTSQASAPPASQLDDSELVVAADDATPGAGAEEPVEAARSEGGNRDGGDNPPRPGRRVPFTYTPFTGNLLQECAPDRSAADLADAAARSDGPATARSPAARLSPQPVEGSPLDGSQQSQSPSQALFSLGGIASPLHMEYGDTQDSPAEPPQLPDSLYQSEHSESQSLWQARRQETHAATAAAGSSEDEHESLSLSQSQTAHSESQNLLPTSSKGAAHQPRASAISAISVDSPVVEYRESPSAVPSAAAPTDAAAEAHAEAEADGHASEPAAADGSDEAPIEDHGQTMARTIPAGFRQIRGPRTVQPTDLDPPAAKRTRGRRGFHGGYASASPVSEPEADSSPEREEDPPVVSEQTTSRLKARAGKRTQRLCKNRYTRDAFKNRPEAIYGRARRNSPAAEAEREGRADTSPSTQRIDSLTSTVDDVPEDPDRRAEQAGLQEVSSPADASEVTGEEQEHKPPEVAAAAAPKTAADAWDWQAWESSEDEEDEEEESSEDEANANEDDGEDAEEDADVGGDAPVASDDQEGTQQLAESDDETDQQAAAKPSTPTQKFRADLEAHAANLDESEQTDSLQPAQVPREVPKREDLVAPVAVVPRRVQTRRRSQRSSQRGAAAEESPAVDVEPWRKVLTTGSRCDAMDGWGKWYEGVVVAVQDFLYCSKPRSLRVHFMSWSAKYQEWFDISSNSLQPLNTHPHAPGGDAPGYVPPELRMNAGRNVEENEDDDSYGFAKSTSKRKQRLRNRSKSSTILTGAASAEEDNAATSTSDDVQASAGFEFDEPGDDDGYGSEEISSDADEEEEEEEEERPASRGRRCIKRKRATSPIVSRRKRASKASAKKKPEDEPAKKETWVEGGRWDVASLGLSRQTKDILNKPSPAAVVAEVAEKPASRPRRAAAVKGRPPPKTAVSPAGERKRKRPSKNLPAIQAAAAAAADKSDTKAVPLTRKRRSDQTHAVATCDGCGEPIACSASAAAGGGARSRLPLVAVHADSPGRALCDTCAKRRAYIRSRAKMGTVVAAQVRGRRSPSVSPARRALPAPKKLFAGYDFAFLDSGVTFTTAAAGAARDLLARQIRSCGGTMVSLTPMYARELDPQKSRLICLASVPKNTAQYLLALAIGAVPLSVEWPTRAMQDEKLVPTASYQLKPLRVPGCGEFQHGQYGQLGQVLPIERRVLRTAKGKAPLLLGVRASEQFTREWEPLLRAAGAHCIPTVTSSVSKQPRVHAYLCDGTNPPSAGSRVPCVSLAWLCASLVTQRRKGFKDHRAFNPPRGVAMPASPAAAAAAYDFEDAEQDELSQRF